MEANIAQGISHLSIPLFDVAPHPKNARRGDVERIAESLSKFGQQKPIVAQKSTKFVIAGNHTWHAAKSLGWEMIACHFTDLSDKEAQGYLIADNRTSDLAEYDPKALARLLVDMRTGDGLEGTGFMSSDVDAILRESLILADEVGSFLDDFISTLGDGPDQVDGAELDGERVVRLSYESAGGRPISIKKLNVTEMIRLMRGIDSARDKFHVEYPGEALSKIVEDWSGENG